MKKIHSADGRVSSDIIMILISERNFWPFVTPIKLTIMLYDAIVTHKNVHNGKHKQP